MRHKNNQANMKLQYASDLHLEFPENKDFLRNNPIKAKGDILLLAGDIVPFAITEQHDDFFDYVSDNFEQTYWIYGHSQRNTTAFEIGKTKLLTNQLGYVKYGKNASYSNKAYITI